MGGWGLKGLGGISEESPRGLGKKSDCAATSKHLRCYIRCIEAYWIRQWAGRLFIGCPVSQPGALKSKRL